MDWDDSQLAIDKTMMKDIIDTNIGNIAVNNLSREYIIYTCKYNKIDKNS